MFVCGGENIQPETVEHYLENVVGVNQACVTSVADEAMGQIGVAFVRLDEGEAWQPEKLQRALMEHLNTHQIPKHYFPWPKEIMNEGIKVARHRLAMLAQTMIESIRNE